jgi:protein-tyrosine-phosphatase
MKILFICNASIGRSQVAHAYFETLSKHHSDSAGIAVDEMKLASKKLKDNANQRSVQYIKRKFGVDISEGKATTSP